MDYKKLINEKIKRIKFDETFVYDAVKKKQYSYSEIMDLAMQINDYLRKQKIEIVYTHLSNSIELLILYFACMKSNIIISPIDIEKTIDPYIAMASGDNKKYMFITEKTILDNDYILVNELFEKVIRYGNYAVVEKYLDTIELDRIFLITYTSGTSGENKGVKHSLLNLLSSAISFGTLMEYDEQTILCHNMPMSYMAGILNTILAPFIMGGKIVLIGRFSVTTAISYWKYVIKYEINTFWMSPTMLHILLKLKPNKEILEYFRNKEVLFSVGTAPLHAQLKKKFEEVFEVTLYQSYGLSETLFLSSERPGIEKKEDSVGVLLENVDIQFSDSEIYINVPWMFKGYTNVNTEEFFEGKYYKTGDLGKIEEEQLFITGRKKDLIIRGGLKISPVKIEKTLLNMENVKECFVGSFIEGDEEKIFCCYVSDCEEDMEVVMNKNITTKLGKSFRIDRFLKVLKIPQNLNGKNDKAAVLEMLQGEKNDTKI